MSLPGPLLVISDRRLARRALPDQLAACCAGGCRWVLLREKDLPRPALAELLQIVLARLAPLGCAVSVSADAELAAACGAQGVHLPQGYDPLAARRRLGAGALIGVSAHSLAEAQQAACAGADYVTLSPIFPTTSKPGYGPPLGLATLQQVAAALPLPVVALGGITPATAAECRRAGAAAVALLGQPMVAEAPAQVVEEILRGARG